MNKLYLFMFFYLAIGMLFTMWVFKDIDGVPEDIEKEFEDLDEDELAELKILCAIAWPYVLVGTFTANDEE